MGEAHEGEEEREMGEATEGEGWCEGKREFAGIVEATEGDWWRGGGEGNRGSNRGRGLVRRKERVCRDCRSYRGRLVEGRIWRMRWDCGSTGEPRVSSGLPTTLT